jgi:hypothetical protein
MKQVFRDPANILRLLPEGGRPALLTVLGWLAILGDVYFALEQETTQRTSHRGGKLAVAH